MSSTAKLAAALMAHRPAGVPYTKHALAIRSIPGIDDTIRADAEDAIYSAVVSYSEAIDGLLKNKTSWAAIKLYYSCFFSIKSCLLLDEIVPFFHTTYYICDTADGSVKKGGASSHQWNWSSIQSIKRLTKWCYSDDSRDAYEKLKQIREESNYKFVFPDPKWQKCFLTLSSPGIQKSFRTYRDDDTFFYTYLPDHLALAYPTRLLLLAIGDAKSKGMKLDEDMKLDEERKAHLKKIWPLKDKPLPD